jgi:hypothetical protein
MVCLCAHLRNTSICRNNTTNRQSIDLITRSSLNGMAILKTSCFTTKEFSIKRRINLCHLRKLLDIYISIDVNLNMYLPCLDLNFVRFSSIRKK